MARIDASRAYHRAFAAQHAVLHDSECLLFLSPLKEKEHLAYAHSGEFRCRAGRAAGTA